MGSSCHGAKRPLSEVDQVKNEWSFTSAPSISLHSLQRDTFTFIYVICIAVEHVLALVFAYYIQTYSNYKGKAIPIQDWTGLQGSRKLRLPP